MALRVAAATFRVVLDRADNLARAAALAATAASNHADLLVLPESFTGSYGVQHFDSNAEVLGEPGSGSAALAAIARRHQMVAVGGVIERCARSNLLYNTIVAEGPEGTLARYRKVHLSKVTVGPDATSEGSVLQPGDRTASFICRGKATTNKTAELSSTHESERERSPGQCDTKSGPLEFCIGLGCCFDLRFADFSAQYAAWGPVPSDVVIYPSAFLASTGSAHWELLLRARALDLQVYTVGANHAHDPTAANRGDTVMWGRSAVVDPWGVVVAETGAESDELAIADVERSRLDAVRASIPLLAQRQPAAYTSRVH
jgi:omega-amidase